jgi:hypothetical protein
MRSPSAGTSIARFVRPGAAEEAIVRGAGGDIRRTFRIVPAISARISQQAAEALRARRERQFNGPQPNSFCK